MLPPADELRRHAIVLVHGAWVGEWCWSPVEPLLRAAGRPVHAVSLTGHGSRRHESGPHVRLADHVADVVGVIESHDLTDVTLVGHSYGGRVITQVWCRASDRIASMVYVDAHAPVAADPGLPPERVAAAEANGWMLPFAGYEPDPAVLGDDGAAWFLARTVDHSLASFTDRWQAELPAALPKTFVYALLNQPSRFAHYAAVCREDPAWRYHEVPGDHWLMLSHPAEVAAIVLEA